ncbi:MAG: ABC transporter substrate-binding protein [Acidimicrobiales bacterium]|nr:ABC transporter substrate-binding protein [Acidimicrobiales bacterium]
MIASRRSTSRAVLAMALAIALCVLAVSCSSDTGNSDSGSGPTAAGQSWSFTDDRGIRHTLPAVPKTIAAQSVAAGGLWEYGIVADGVFGPLRRTDGTPDPAIGIADPDAFESLGEVDSEINLEALAALKPDIIVTSMWGDSKFWGISDDEVDEIEKIAPIVGIRVEGRTLDEPLRRYAELASSLDADPAKIDAARKRFEDASTNLERALERKPGLRFVAASGTPSEMYVAYPPGFPDLAYFDKLGMDIVEPEAHTTSGGFWETLSWEQADKYPADVILADARGGTLAQILDFLPPTARALPAVKADQLIQWKAAQAYGYGASARIVEELAAAVRRAERTSAS